MTRTPAPRHPAARRGRRRAAVALLAAVALAGCSGGASDSSASSAGSSGAGGSADAVPRAESAARGTALTAGGAAGQSLDGGTSTSAKPAAVPAEGRRQVRTGDLSVRVSDVDAAVARVRSLATAADGYVGEERTVTDPGQPKSDRSRTAGTSSQLTLRVPEAGLDRVMSQVAGLGTPLSRASSSTDVSDTYVDTVARLQTQRESVARVRALLGRATTIGQVVQVEGQLAGRTAELEALEARLVNLDDQTTLATLKVSLTPPIVTAALPAKAEAAGFVSGLREGWDALAASTRTALVVLGALLPFAAVAAVVGVPVWLVTRRRRVRAAASA